jgi:two-component system cell cycle sensor histidine kinase/response regulator CckA
VPHFPTLEETIAQLEATLESTHDGILVVDLDRRVVRFNRQFVDMFGLPPDLVARRNTSEMLAYVADQLEDPEATRLRSEALWSAASTEYLSELRFKDGRVFERFVSPQRIGDTVVGRVISYRDISRAIRTEQALDQHRAFLEKAQEVAHIGSWVAELDQSHRLGWSVETHRIFGVPVGQFAGTSTAFFEFVHPDDREMVRQASAAAAQGAVYDIEHRILRTDGSVRWVHERADIVRDAEGRGLRMIGTVQDITERRQLEDQLRQSQKMEAIGRLAGGIAHDLNNALTAIAGYVELALGAVAADHPARADVEEIRRAAERAGSVTRQLLAFSRKQLLAPRVFDLGDTVTTIARLLSRLLGPAVRVRTRLDEAVPPILGDPGQVEQAIINLAVNARDAMPKGGELVLATSFDTVDETAARAHVPMPPGRYVALRVSDTGHGMSRETQARIFEPFFTTKAVGKGTGLGLSMVYGTLKQIGGFIFVSSEIDRGTTFQLYFPPAPPQAAGAARRPAPEEDARRGHETLLVVEDEPAVRNLVGSALRHDGYTLLLATSAEEAQQIANAHQGPIDLLLTDAIMPGKSGIELANALVASRSGLRVVVMSGYTEEDLSVGGLSQSVVLLQKPFTPRELRRRIREVLDR